MAFLKHRRRTAMAQSHPVVGAYWRDCPASTCRARGRLAAPDPLVLADRLPSRLESSLEGVRLSHRKRYDRVLAECLSKRVHGTPARAVTGRDAA